MLNEKSVVILALNKKILNHRCFQIDSISLLQLDFGWLLVQWHLQLKTVFQIKDFMMILKHKVIILQGYATHAIEESRDSQAEY